jgi:hypothetical protein
MSISIRVSWSGRWMMMLSGEWFCAVPGEVDALAADLERASVAERLVVRGPRRVVVAQQEPPRLFVPEAGDVRLQERLSTRSGRGAERAIPPAVDEAFVDGVGRTVVIADDDLALREGLASLLTHAGYSVVGQAAT